MDPVLALINVPVVEKAVEQDFTTDPALGPNQVVSQEALQDGDCQQGGKEGKFGRRLPVAGQPGRVSEEQ